MAIVKPFKGIRPPKDLVEQVESRPYDVLDSEEARAEAGDNEKSLYHIIKPEINFEPGTSEYDPRVYESAAENFKKFQKKGWLRQDEKEQYYIYAQTMNGKTQYGLVVGAYVNDYMTGVIKKHELTRRDKEEDRMKHVREDKYYNALQVKFAYAVTCHKAQGGQWAHVYLDQGYMTDDMLTPDYIHWLYTAFTRATEKLFLVNWPKTQTDEI